MLLEGPTGGSKPGKQTDVMRGVLVFPARVTILRALAV